MPDTTIQTSTKTEGRCTTWAFVQKILHTGLIRFMVLQAISDCMTLVFLAKMSYVFSIMIYCNIAYVLLSDKNCIRNFYAMVSNITNIDWKVSSIFGLCFFAIMMGASVPRPLYIHRIGRIIIGPSFEEGRGSLSRIVCWSLLDWI